MLLLPSSSPPPNTVTHHDPKGSLLSGVILDKTAPVGQDTGFLPLGASILYQTFRFPTGFTRGVADETKIPELTGFQFFVGVDGGYANTAALDWTLQRYQEGEGWTFINQGTSVGTHTDGNELWFNIFFQTPVAILSDWVNDLFRVGINSRSAQAATHDQPVEYDGTFVTIAKQKLRVVPDIAVAPLQPDTDYLFTLDGVPSILEVDGSGSVFYSVQQGVNRAWYSVPTNSIGGVKLYAADGVTTIMDSGREVSLQFRLLASTADDGTDFLGNPYRSVVVKSGMTNVDTQGEANHYWLSGPQPSKFAVVNNFFDVRPTATSDEGVVIDRVLVDPITPGVFFHIYYSNDPSPGTDEDSWNNLLWTPVQQTFQMTKRDTHALPAPITAKYIKIEYCHLQERFYSPGAFQKPITYSKHPKWVLDYFLTRLELDNQFTPNTVQLTYDALDLAYQYYRDDLTQAPRNPDSLTQPTNLTSLLSQENATFTADGNTLNRIRIAFQPYLTRPSLQQKLQGYLLGDYLLGTDAASANYSTEILTRQQSVIDEVSSLDRQSVILEKSWPLMYFFITARHGYRTSKTTFDNDKAYFAGVREIAFTREHYYARDDTALYIESVGDDVNVERNDFFRDSPDSQRGPLLVVNRADGIAKPSTFSPLALPEESAEIYLTQDVVYLI